MPGETGNHVERSQQALEPRPCGAPTARRSGRAQMMGRQREIEALEKLLDRVRAGASGALILRGEAGVGKSALLERLVEAASGCRIVRAAGIESEMEIPYAGLHQLCVPMLDSVERLPRRARHRDREERGTRTHVVA